MPTSQTMAVRSRDADANDLPSWENRRAVTWSLWPWSAATHPSGRRIDEQESIRGLGDGQQGPGRVEVEDVAGGLPDPAAAELAGPRVEDRAARDVVRRERLARVRRPAVRAELDPTGNRNSLELGQLRPQRHRRRRRAVAGQVPHEELGGHREPVAGLALEPLDDRRHRLAVRAEVDVDHAHRPRRHPVQLHLRRLERVGVEQQERVTHDARRCRPPRARRRG